MLSSYVAIKTILYVKKFHAHTQFPTLLYFLAISFDHSLFLSLNYLFLCRYSNKQKTNGNRA